MWKKQASHPQGHIGDTNYSKKTNEQKLMMTYNLETPRTVTAFVGVPVVDVVVPDGLRVALVVPPPLVEFALLMTLSTIWINPLFVKTLAWMSFASLK